MEERARELELNIASESDSIPEPKKTLGEY